MKNGLLIEYGHHYWYKNGQLHREDGPAIIFYNGKKRWFINGKPHRTDGPAVTYSKIDYQHGFVDEWWLNGIRFTYDEWLNKSKDFIVQENIKRLI